MSVKRVEVAQVQFQIESRQANASIKALEAEAEVLNKKMAETKASIKALGDVPEDNPQLLAFQKQAKQLKRDVDDVNKTIKDYTRGVKAADELLRNYDRQTIESMSMKAIKAGQNGLKKRIENIDPDKANAEELKAYRIIQEVIRESQRVVDDFRADYAETIRILKEGGTVSEQTMKRTRDALKDLMEGEREGTQLHAEYRQQYEFMVAKVNEYAEALRREKGEIVDANDARQAAVKLTREGAEAARQEVAAQQQVIDTKRQDIEATQKLREETRQQLAETERLRQAKEDEMNQTMNEALSIERKIMAVDKEHETERVAAADARRNADTLKETADKQKTALEEERTAVANLGGEVDALRQKLEELRAKQAEPIKPKVDTSEIERLNQELQEAETLLQQKTEVANGAFNAYLGKKGLNTRREYNEYRAEFVEKFGLKGSDRDFRWVGAADKLSTPYDMRRFEIEEAAQGEGDWAIDKGHAKQILEDYDWFSKKIEEVHKKISDEYRKLYDAIHQGVDPEQLKTVASNIGKLEELKEKMLSVAEDSPNDSDLRLGGGDTFRAQFGDIDKLFESTSRNIDRAMKKAIGERFEFHDKKHALEIQEAKQASETADAEKDAAQKTVDAIKKKIEAQQQSTQSTEQETQATEQQAQSSQELQQVQTQLTAKEAEHAKAVADLAQHETDYATAVQKASDAESTAAEMEGKLAQQDEQDKRTLEEKNKLLEQQQTEYDTLDQKQQQQREQLAQYDQQIASGEQAVADAEREKHKARELSEKDMRDAIAALEQQNRTISESDPLWEQNNRTIAQYNQRLEEMKQRSQELRGEVLSLDEAMGVATEAKDGTASVERMEQAAKVIEEARKKATDPGDVDKYANAIDTLTNKLREVNREWMSVAQAEEIASKAGTDGFIATQQQMTQAVQAIERQRDALVKTIQQKQRDGAETKKEEAELQRLEKVLRDLKFEQDNFNMSHKQMTDLLKQPKSADDLDQLKLAIKRADAELHRMKGSLGENNKQYQDFAKQVKAAKEELKQMESQAKATTSQWDQAWSRLKTYVGMYMGFNVVLQKLSGTMGDLMDLSDRMGEVRKTTGFTADEVGRLTTELKKLDTRTGLTGLMELASIAGSIGLKTQQEVEGFTKAANQLTVALPEMGNEAARTLMKIADATGDLEKNGRDVETTLEKVGSTIIALRANSAAAAGPITDFVSRVGAVGAQAGISIDQIAALGATVDALGGRVEMSATALSRMIPAIRNNSFAVAQAIGITEEKLKGMDGMQQMVAIFRRLHDSVKDFDMTTEEGMNAAADAVENMMGKSTSMKEVMATLNQQGARAGIVFGLLSQNVDKLEDQLKLAGEAYKSNTALMDEYIKMNDTTAAKWAKLKNQLEEFFVGDQAQRWLGGIIDGLRWIIDAFTGNGVWRDTLRTITAFLLATKLNIFGIITGITGVNGGLKGVATWLGIIDKTTKKIAWGNIFTAVASAALYAIWAISSYNDELNKLSKAMAELDNEEAEAERSVSHLTTAINASAKKTEDAKKKQNELEKQTEALRKEVDTLKKSNDNSTEATDKLNKKTEELEQSEKDLEEATKEANKATDDRLKLINEFNSKYSTYLGYLLDEKTATEQVALAHMQVVAALKEELEQKRLNRQTESVDEEYNEKLTKAGAAGRASLRTLPSDMQRRIESQWNTVRGRIQYNVDKQGNETFTLPAIEGLSKEAVTKGSYKELRGALEELFTTIVRNEVQEAESHTDREENKIKINLGTHSVQTGTSTAGIALYSEVSNTLEEFSRQAFNQFDRWTDLTLKREQRLDEVRRESEDYSKGTHANSVEAANTMNEDAYNRITATLGTITGNQQLSSETIGTLAQQANIITANLNKFKGELKDADNFIGKDNEASLKNAVDTMYSKLTEAQRKQILEAAQKSSANGKSGNGGGGGNNPYGSYDRVTSPYSEWNGNDLVARRKEMLERVKALANGADVQAVLSEDAKFITEATRNNIKTTQQAIEWYNTERLKIQDALYAKHLTNTGDWKDPEKVRKRFSRVVQDEMKYYLDELDAYYTERNQLIQQKRNDEEITEGEAWLQTIRNETEWYQRRAELQKLYADKSKEVTEQEQQAIFGIISERTGETVKYIKANVAQTVKLIDDVGQKSKEAMKRIKGDIDLGTEKDELKSAKAVGKSVKFMADTLAKERPLNGIVDDLQTTLAKMGILEGQVPEKMRVLIGEIENAYTTDVKGLVKRIKDAGFTEWARQIEGDTTMQQALMAQLRKAYEAVQEAIRKEASRIKKDADMMWKTILLPDGTSLKQATDEVLARMTQQQDSVSRANSLIGAGVASDNVATKLAIKQLQLQMSIQQAQFALMRKIGNEKAQYLDQLAKELELSGKLTEAERARKDAANVRKSLELAVTEETKKQQELSNQIAKEQEEAQNRLYTELREWGDLLASSLQSIFEASAAGNEDYYNELAKLNLTGKGGPGAGTYVVIDDEGTSDAKAHYEYLDERQALERQHEIEQENARAEAWRKVMDDLNQKMSEQITDWLNAAAQNASTDANTAALGTLTTAENANTNAMTSLSEQMAQLAEAFRESTTAGDGGTSDGGTTGTGETSSESGVSPAAQQKINDQNAVTQNKLENDKKEEESEKNKDKKMTTSSQSTFAKMTLAANMYGVAYQAMSNDNLSTTQKFEMMALQAVGNYAIGALTTEMAAASAKAATDSPGVLGTLWKQLGWAAAPVFAIFTGLLGGLMGLATSKISKAKSTIAQATGSSSASAGRLATGMLTYAEGNVNEFTDPATLTPGRQYNVDAADGRTYRARYMGSNPKTHITNGPEFHLSGERGREMIIDAGTTRQITMNENEIWHAIQTLSAGGSMRRSSGSLRRRGVRAFADGNLDEFDDMMGSEGMDGMGTDLSAIQSSLDRNSAIQEALLERLNEPIVAQNILYGPDGLPNILRKLNKQADRHGEKYL